MKRQILCSLAVACAFCLYVGSACISVKRLVVSAQAGNASEILARTNLPLLKQSLVDQIVGSYRRRSGQTKPVSQLERTAANTYGASVADAMLTKLLTPENLTELLRTGNANLPLHEGGSIWIPPLNELGSGVSELIKRLAFIQLRLIDFRMSSASGDDAYSISMHFEGDVWKFAGLHLPANVASQVAERSLIRGSDNFGH
jgi:hypothetical protein